MDGSIIQHDSIPFLECGNSTDEDRFRYAAQFPEYGSFVSRLQSFANSQWSPVEQRNLAVAGFFDPGRKHTMQCFYCGLRLLSDLNGKHDPWRDHAKHVGTNGCAYLCYMKELNFVQNKGEESSEDSRSLCFDRGGGPSGWIPCQAMDSCKLCIWEFWMTPQGNKSE